MTALVGQFDLEEFEAFCAEFGQSISWAKSVLCPCQDERSGGASPTCVGCAGLGRVWLTAIDFTLPLSAFTAQREFTQFAEIEKGDAILTIPETYLNKRVSPYIRVAVPLYDGLGEYDRVVQTAGALRFQQQLTRGTNDTLRHAVPVSTQEVCSVGLSALTYYTSPADYSLVGRTITWVTGRGPAAGALYSVTYLARPEWYVYRDLVMQRPHMGMRLPRKVHLREADAFWKGHGGAPT